VNNNKSKYDVYAAAAVTEGIDCVFGDDRVVPEGIRCGTPA